MAAEERKSTNLSNYNGIEKFVPPAGHDPRHDHFVRFFTVVRGGAPIYEDAVFGYRAAAPALLCNESQAQNKMIGWDPVNMKVTS